MKLLLTEYEDYVTFVPKPLLRQSAILIQDNKVCQTAYNLGRHSTYGLDGSLGAKPCLFDTRRV